MAKVSSISAHWLSAAVEISSKYHAGNASHRPSTQLFETSADMAATSWRRYNNRCLLYYHNHREIRNVIVPININKGSTKIVCMHATATLKWHRAHKLGQCSFIIVFRRSSAASKSIISRMSHSLRENIGTIIFICRNNRAICITVSCLLLALPPFIFIDRPHTSDMRLPRHLIISIS